jgi:glutamate formiminotransferase/formiminotetrahydrofolate cyclodeaminase
MKQIVECVPNFSEGRDMRVIDAIRESITAVNGVKFISAEPDKDYNRTVVTFVGSPDGVVEAAFRSTKTAADRIDMTKHKGEHPRMGATDVVPFVPVSGVTMEDCVQLAHRYGSKVAKELGIPIYLYEEAAATPERANLSNVRKGEYEGLEEKLRDPAWKPDYGEPRFNPRSGATATGARVFLIAYNVNLNTNNDGIANEIALIIRESGRIRKDASGKPVLDAKGNKVKIPGTLKSVKAMGVLLEAHNIAQVSINLVNFNVTPPHVAFEEVKKQARALGAEATGSEIVGLTPMEALLMAGRFYAPEEHQEERLVHAAVEKLGLSQLAPFDPKQKVIEYQL